MAQKLTNSYDLGHDWFANIYTSEDGKKTMTIRSPERGQRINLNEESFETLKNIFAAAENQEGK